MVFVIPSDYEASLKKEGGIPDGPVLESLLAGETLDKKVETKEEEPMSECQVGRRCSALSHLMFCVSLLSRAPAATQPLPGGRHCFKVQVQRFRECLCWVLAKLQIY